MTRVLSTIAVLLFATQLQLAQSNTWQGLTPLVSTRTDVERLFGQPNKEKIRFANEYDTKDGVLDVVYSGKACDRGWKVPVGTVLSLRTPPSRSEVNKSASELGLDKKNFSITGDDAFYGRWTNPESGIEYNFRDMEQSLINITYIPKASDNSLRCNGFPPFFPDRYYGLYERGDLFWPKVSERENIWRTATRLIHLGVQLESNFKGYKGYALFYFDRKRSFSQYRRFLKKVRDHAGKQLKKSSVNVEIIEGGINPENGFELYILPKDWKPPAPDPFLPSPQFWKKETPKSKSNTLRD